ncbi:MAG: alpha/beta fold hydrolase [Spirochaetales bacterium]
MEGRFLPSFDDTKLFAYEYDEVKKPRAVVQIIHGMAEHSKRYENVINFLNANGFIVFINDHRAHGKTAGELNRIGKYEKDIFYDTVRDQIYFSEYLIDKYKLPLIVLGHSFGSFIAQRYNELYNRHSALILSGSSYLKNAPSVLFGKLISLIGTKVKGVNAPARLISNMSFQKYNRSFVDRNWLTSDKDEQQKQRVDRYCNKIFSYNFYKYFLKGVLDIYKTKNLQKISPKIPMLILSGQKDALTKNGALVKKLDEFYKKCGVNKVEVKVYENDRHEVLNEVNRKAVYEDILKFVLENVKIKEN